MHSIRWPVLGLFWLWLQRQTSRIFSDVSRRRVVFPLGALATRDASRLGLFVEWRHRGETTDATRTALLLLARNPKAASGGCKGSPAQPWTWLCGDTRCGGGGAASAAVQTPKNIFGRSARLRSEERGRRRRPPKVTRATLQNSPREYYFHLRPTHWTRLRNKRRRTVRGHFPNAPDCSTVFDGGMWIT